MFLVALLTVGLTVPSLSSSDTAPPAVVSTVPAPDAAGVPVDSTLVITVSEPLDPETVHAGSVYLQYASARVHAVVTLSEDGTVIGLDPYMDLPAGATHYATVVGGPEGSVTDLAGNHLPSSERWMFTTNASPRIRVLAPERGAVVTDRSPRIAFRVRDDGGELAADQVAVKVDGSSRPFSWDGATGTLAPRLGRGEHVVIVRAVDDRGLPARTRWRFTVS